MATESGVAKAWESAKPRLPNGAAIAALYGGVIGLLVLGISNIYADLDPGFSKAITLNAGIGPYSGKELLMFVAWVVSWVVLHAILRKREANLKRWFGIFLVLLLVATLLVWPPIFEFIADSLKGG